jgi:hypothetical protein
MRGAIPPLPNTSSWSGAQLKHRGNFTFTNTIYFETPIIERNMSQFHAVRDNSTKHIEEVGKGNRVK